MAAALHTRTRVAADMSKASEMEPGNATVRQHAATLKRLVDERNEKLKAEMLGTCLLCCGVCGRGMAAAMTDTADGRSVARDG